jgi:hypothetical protein
MARITSPHERSMRHGRLMSLHQKSNSHRAPLEREEDPSQQMNTENKQNPELIIQKKRISFSPTLEP